MPVNKYLMKTFRNILKREIILKSFLYSIKYEKYI